MDAELWKQVDEMLDAALELPPAEREGYVATACGDNEELRHEVLSLLRAQEQAGTFLAGSAMRVAAQALARESAETTRGTLVGCEVGNYQIEKLLGVGGMGRVWLARDETLANLGAMRSVRQMFSALRRKGYLIDGETVRVSRGRGWPAQSYHLTAPPRIAFELTAS